MADLLGLRKKRLEGCNEGDAAIADFFGVSARYCVRQDAHAFLMSWGLLLVLLGAAVLAVRWRARFLACAAAVFAVLTGALSIAIFYGCSMTAASEQGMGSDLPARTYTFLRCLGWDALGSSVDWTALTLSCVAAIALIAVAIRHRRRSTRIAAGLGVPLLLIVTLVSGFFLLFGFSWCTSERLI